jgi:hypothetical protein
MTGVRHFRKDHQMRYLNFGAYPFACAIVLLVPPHRVVHAQCEALYTLVSPTPGGEFGYSVAGLLDVDGDDKPDFAVGAPGNDGGGLNTGAVFVYRGSDGSLLHSIFGPLGHNLGRRVASAGDVNSDGFDDIIVSTKSAGGSLLKRVFVYSGFDGQALHMLQGTSSDDEFGFAISALDDVNGDGFEDFAVGDPQWTPPIVQSETGRVSVFSGKDGTELYFVPGVSPPPQVGHHWFGAAIASMDDVNEDGIRELVVAAYNPQASPGLHELFVLSGADGTLIHQIQQPASGIAFAYRVDGLSDINGDGVADFLAGSRSFTGSVYLAHVYSGADASIISTVSTPNFPETEDLGQMQSGPSPIDQKIDVAAAGDVTGDGRDDIVFGDANYIGGRTWVCSAIDNQKIQRLKGSAAWPPPQNWFGYAVDGIGDLTGDGKSEIIIGAPFAEGTGRAYVHRVTRRGDLNCDGTVDVADLMIVIDTWGNCPILNPPQPCFGDAVPFVNGNNTVSVDDLLIVINEWGT